ncbi:hypothetical protein [Aestuariivirga sp.]
MARRVRAIFPRALSIAAGKAGGAAAGPHLAALARDMAKPEG